MSDETGRSEILTDDDKELIAASFDMIKRAGASDFSLRFSEAEGDGPLVWIAIARVGDAYVTASHVRTLQAITRLVEELMDGGMCVHCSRPTIVDPDWRKPVTDMPGIDAAFCAYVYDPSLGEYRRGCR